MACNWHTPQGGCCDPCPGCPPGAIGSTGDDWRVEWSNMYREGEFAGQCDTTEHRGSGSVHAYDAEACIHAFDALGDGWFGVIDCGDGFCFDEFYFRLATSSVGVDVVLDNAANKVRITRLEVQQYTECDFENNFTVNRFEMEYDIPAREDCRDEFSFTLGDMTVVSISSTRTGASAPAELTGLPTETLDTILKFWYGAAP